MPRGRADRQTSSDDNERNNPTPQRREPIPRRELEQLLMTIRSQKDEWQQRAKENEKAATQLVQVQQKIETYQLKANEWEERATQNQQFYIQEQQNHQQTHCLYNQEKARAIEWLTKYEEANTQREQYLTLYNDTKEQLKYERRSKAAIKGWQTRRKFENERLKREIGGMTVLLRESLERKDEAVNNLYIVAERMDRIQQLVDSVQEKTTTPMNLLQKLKRIWLAIREILGE